MAFRQLADRLAGEDAITRVVGRAASVLAVAEPARAITMAALALGSDRRPVLVATPTSAEADRLVADLESYLGPDEVVAFPAWETLPFERISPSIEAMGKRLRTLWYVQDPSRCPRVVVAPLRALLQRLSPHAEDVEPIIVGAEDRVDQDELVRSLVAFGYRREAQVEHRGEIAVRGSIVDVFPSTAEGPYRIDLWGDEVDRLCEFTIADQRSTRDRAEIEIFPCRELLASDDVGKRAEALLGAEPWGREQWQRLADGELFEGMESWLPWLTDDERTITDLMPADGLIVLVEPRMMRDRGADLLAEEADLAVSLARTWGADDHGGSFPTLHLPFDRLLARTPVRSISMTADAPDGDRSDRPPGSGSCWPSGAPSPPIMVWPYRR